MPFDLANIVRPKILNLEPYRCARDDFTEGILLDANENAHGPTIKGLTHDSQLHRYPDPHQLELKKAIANYRNESSVFKTKVTIPLTSDNICLGVGSDESIDALIRACCVPGKEKILVMPPTYSMYSVCANINDVEVVSCPLKTNDNSFQMDTDAAKQILLNDNGIKLAFITSPGNPTGAQINVESIVEILSIWDRGFVVVDEAYVDFSTKGSIVPLIAKFPNLVVLQTLSKSFGLAGIRLGMTFTSDGMARVLNSMKAPYNISSMASDYALQAFRPENLRAMESNAKIVNQSKLKLLRQLTALDFVDDQHVGGLDANFIMVRIKNGDNDLAQKLYYELATKSKVVVRFRGNEPGCKGCLRITVGMPEENEELVKQFKTTLTRLVYREQ